MPLSAYGVLKGRGSPGVWVQGHPHYQIQIVDEIGANYRIAINVRVQLAPSELMYHIKSHFVHPVTAVVFLLPNGFTRLAPNPESGALHYHAAEQERVEGARSILHKAAGEPTRADNCLLANFFS